jgi:hypothetical protein
MRKVNIWFNRTFSTAFFSIKELKESGLPYEFRIYGTHKHLRSAFLQACDRIDLEPSVYDDKYIDFALDYCRKNRIDILVPGEFTTLIIARSRHLFEEIGVRIMNSADTGTLERISSKSSTYSLIEDCQEVSIPEYYTARDIDEFKEAYQRLINSGKQACFKPDVSQGGLGFRIISENHDPCHEIFNYPGNINTFSYYYEALKKCKSFPVLMVLEYLPGPELSVDCLANSGLMLHCVPRRKVQNIRIVERNDQAEKATAEICSKLSLNNLFNIQFRCDAKGVLRLLEINPRQSGGMHYAGKAGHKMMTAAVERILCGKNCTFPDIVTKSFIELDDSLPIDYY